MPTLRLADMENVRIEPCSSTAYVAWEFGERRFHVWIERGKLDVVLHSNPRDARADRSHRALDFLAPKYAALRQDVLAFAPAGKVQALIDEARAQKDAEFAAKLEAERLRRALESTAPELLEAAKCVLDYATLDTILADQRRHKSEVFAIRIGDLRALAAVIAKAEGRS